MKYVKAFTLTMLFSVMATTAHADGIKLSLFQCGLKLGATTRVHKENSESKNNREYGTNKAFKSIDSSRFGVANFTGAPPKETGRRRLPPAFTLARVGCSWR